jgi:uncharacterized membrane protein YcaP (DUF421 family)
MDIVLRAALAFVFIFFLTRVLGRRELNSLEPFDLIMLVMLGDLVQQGVTQNDFSVTGLMLAAGTVGILTLAFSFASYRFPRLRPVLEGEPLILVEDGKAIERNIHRERLTLEEIAAEARKQQISSLEDVQWAVLETGGTISFIPKSGS